MNFSFGFGPVHALAPMHDGKLHLPGSDDSGDGLRSVKI